MWESDRVMSVLSCWDAARCARTWVAWGKQACLSPLRKHGLWKDDSVNMSGSGSMGANRYETGELGRSELLREWLMLCFCHQPV